MFPIDICNMQSNFELKNDLLPPVPPPPPPPPPLPSSRLSQSASKKLTSKHSNSTPSPDISRYINSLFEDVHINIVSFCKPVQPVIQEGPSCGIVALSMASQFFKDNKTSEEILAVARAAEFSKGGEMFSAYCMASLATSLIDCEALVVNNLTQNKCNILSNICRGWPVLIPYDADKNHEPCLNNGLNAHWALLCGLCFSVSEEAYPLLEECSTDGEVPHFYNLPCGSQAEKFIKFATKMCVYARQGKSKHLALWNLDTLLLSNNNLFEITKKYNHSDMVLPSNGLMDLNDKAVLLKEKGH